MSANGTYTFLVASYDDDTSAQADFAALRELEKGGAITIIAAVVASRDEAGEVHVDERGDHSTAAGTTIGAGAGLLLAIVFPPSLLGGAIFGGAIGGVIGKFRQRHHKSEIAESAEASMAPGTSAVVAIIEDRYVEAVEKALAASEKVTTEAVDAATVEEAKQEAASA